MPSIVIHTARLLSYTILQRGMRFIDKICKLGTILMFSAMAISVLLQVSTRLYVRLNPSDPIKPFGWTEELARIFFILGIAMAAPLAYHAKQFVRVDIISSRLSGIALLITETCTHILVIFCTLVLAYTSIEWISLGWREQASTIPLPLAIPRMVVPIVLGLISLHAMLHISDEIIAFHTHQKKNKNHTQKDASSCLP